jgi:hypothetical protein
MERVTKCEDCGRGRYELGAVPTPTETPEEQQARANRAGPGKVAGEGRIKCGQCGCYVGLLREDEESTET